MHGGAGPAQDIFPVSPDSTRAICSGSESENPRADGVHALHGNADNGLNHTSCWMGGQSRSASTVTGMNAHQPTTGENSVRCTCLDSNSHICDTPRADQQAPQSASEGSTVGDSFWANFRWSTWCIEISKGRLGATSYVPSRVIIPATPQIPGGLTEVTAERRGPSHCFDLPQQ